MVVAISRQFGFGFAPLEEETKVVFGALQWAWELSFDALEIDSDSLQFIEALRKRLDFSMS